MLGRNSEIKTFFSKSPNDLKISRQHIATTCCARLATPYCDMVGAVNRIIAHALSQQHARMCAQQCYDMLRWNVAIVWLGLNKEKTFPGLYRGIKTRPKRDPQHIENMLGWARNACFYKHAEKLGLLNKLGKTRIYYIAQRTPFSCGKQLSQAGFSSSYPLT